jgi:hypothetical protein
MSRENDSAGLVTAAQRDDPLRRTVLVHGVCVLFFGLTLLRIWRSHGGPVPPFRSAAALAAWLALFLLAGSALHLVLVARRVLTPATLLLDLAGYLLLIPFAAARLSAGDTPGAAGLVVWPIAILLLRPLVLLGALETTLRRAGPGADSRGRGVSVSAAWGGIVAGAALAAQTWRPPEWSPEILAPAVVAWLPAPLLLAIGAALTGLFAAALLHRWGRKLAGGGRVGLVLLLLLPPLSFTLPASWAALPGLLVLELLAPRAVDGPSSGRRRLPFLLLAMLLGLLDPRWGLWMAAALLFTPGFRRASRLPAAAGVLLASLAIHVELADIGLHGGALAALRRVLSAVIDGGQGVITAGPLLLMGVTALLLWAAGRRTDRGSSPPVALRPWAAVTLAGGAGYIALVGAPYGGDLLLLPLLLSSLTLLADPRLPSWRTAGAAVIALLLGAGHLAAWSFEPSLQRSGWTLLARLVHAGAPLAPLHPLLDAAHPLLLREVLLGLVLLLAGALIFLPARGRQRLRPELGAAAFALALPLVALAAMRFGDQRTTVELEPAELGVGFPRAMARLATPTRVDMVELISSLGSADRVPQGAVVARIELLDGGGGVLAALPLRAGVHTAEWAWERPDIRDRIAHELAPVAFTWPSTAPDGSTFPAHRYRAVWAPGIEAPVSGVRVTFEAPPGARRSLRIDACRLFSGRSLAPAQEVPLGRLRLDPGQPTQQRGISESAGPGILEVWTALRSGGSLRRGELLATLSLIGEESLIEIPLRAGVELAPWPASAPRPGWRALGGLVLYRPLPGGAIRGCPVRTVLPPGLRLRAVRLDAAATLVGRKGWELSVEALRIYPGRAPGVLDAVGGEESGHD